LQKSWIRSGNPRKGKALYDSNILIAYLFREERRFDIAKEVLAKHSNRYMSIISIHEIGYYSRKMGTEVKFVEIKPKLSQLIKPLQIDQETCMHAINLRSLEKLPEIDSLIAATAIRYNIDYFYTFDQDFTQLNNRRLRNTIIIKL